MELFHQRAYYYLEEMCVCNIINVCWSHPVSAGVFRGPDSLTRSQHSVLQSKGQAVRSQWAAKIVLILALEEYYQSNN